MCSAFIIVPALPATKAAPTPLTVGVLTSAPSTFFQNEIQDYFIGTPTISIPYLSYGDVGLNGVFSSNIGNEPTPIAGSNDTQWIMNLVSPNLKWSDGVALNSTDLAFSFGLFLPTGPYANESLADPYGQIQGTVDSISILNSTAIQVNLSSPTPLWPFLAYLYDVYPYHYFKQFATGFNGIGNASIVGGPGDSPYVPQGYAAGSSTMTLVANPYSIYWNGKSPTMQTITIDMFATETALVNALAAGQIDSASITPSDVATLSSTSALSTATVPSQNQMWVYLRTTGYPWNITAFRQALLYLENRTEIKSVVYNNEATDGNAIALVPQGMNQYWPGSSTPLYNYSVSTANQLLQKAGLHQDSSGKWMYPNGTAVSITIETTNSDPNYVRASQLFATALQNAGITASVSAVDFATAETDFGAVNFQYLVYPNEVSSIPFRALKNPANYPNYVNSSFRSLILDSIHNTNATQALQELKTAELYFANAAAWNSVVVLPVPVAYNSQLFTGWQPAISQVPNHDSFHDPTTDELVLTSVTPISLSSSTTSSTSSPASGTSTTSATSTTSSSTSSTTALSAYVVYMVGIAAGVIVVVSGVASYSRRKKPVAGS
jgi:ABC-type oligopeptide transport system substrate-binding subunit